MAAVSEGIVVVVLEGARISLASMLSREALPNEAAAVPATNVASLMKSRQRI
jgi:hypothetical protein